MSNQSIPGRIKTTLRPMAKNMSWLAGGIILSLGVTVAAQQYTATLPTEPPCDYGKIVQNIVNQKVQQVAMTSTDPDRYFNQDCLGDFVFALLDLSILIPDPIGLLTDAAVAAVNKIKQAVVNKICSAVRNTIGDTIGQYNDFINGVNDVTGSLTGRTQNYIDTTIGNQSRIVQDKFNLNYSTPNPTGTVTNLIPANPNLPTFTTPPTTTQTPGTAQPVTTPSIPVPQSTPPAQSGAVASTTSGWNTKPATPPSIGSSIFGK